jgi:hypothetical protein
MIAMIIRHLYTDVTPFNGNSPFNTDIHAISICNKQLRRISLPLLYDIIHISDMKKHPCRVLQPLIEWPDHAKLVKHLTLVYSNGKPSGAGSRENAPITSHMNRSIVEQFKSNPECIDAANEVLKRHPYTEVLLLLYLVSHLENLVIDSDRHLDDKHIYHHISELMDKRFILPKLRMFAWNGGVGFKADLLIPILLQPSITEIKIQRLRPCDSLGEWPCHRKSNVQKISFYQADMNPEILTKLLQVSDSLNSFIYYKHYSSPYSEAEVFEGLKSGLDYVAQSLERLEVGYDDLFALHSRPAIWSFSNYTCLKVLYINYALLYGFNPTTAPCIAHSLPPTLAVIIMRGTSSQWTNAHHVETWRRLLVKKSSTCLENLKIIGHFLNWWVLEPLADLARSQDIKIALKWADIRE